MHEYYKKNQKKLVKQMKKILGPVKADIEDVTGVDGNYFLKKVENVYVNQYLQYLPYIGGSKNSGTMNLTHPAFLAAMYDYGRRYGMTVYEAGEISAKAFDIYYDSFPKFLLSAISKLLYSDLSQKILKKIIDRKKIFADKYPYAWLSEYQEPDREYSHRFIIHRCGIYEFLKDRDIAEFIPYICNLDYIMFGKLGIPLRRNKTISCGDESCDFLFAREGEVADAWPPPFLDPDNDLK
ncbi:MAG: L-2-amino-thiazoline-4-carboxylic acid hydrolase [Tissierellia bacterium]|nr:L-2-amino-thiazoline-4-carboxylic acid hydrolase [Tissierellia bacterium]